MGLLLFTLLILLIISFFMPVMSFAVILIIGLSIIHFIYETVYYKSKKFLDIKIRIQDHISNCNELNAHIEDLKNTYRDFRIDKTDYGHANFVDSSKFKYKRPKFKTRSSGNMVHQCSRVVATNAKKQPFKYLCKYFDIKADEKTLEFFENTLNNFSAAENGKQVLLDEKQDIMDSIDNEIPFLIKKINRKKLEKKLGFEEIDLSDAYFPKFIFQYVSSGGNSSYTTEIILDIDNMERFINFLAEKIRFKKSIEGQRRLMT